MSLDTPHPLWYNVLPSTIKEGGSPVTRIEMIVGIVLILIAPRGRRKLAVIDWEHFLLELAILLIGFTMVVAIATL